MTKFIKVFFVFILIFTCGCFGAMLYDNPPAEQPAYLLVECDNYASTSTPPESYDLRDYIDIGVENQYNFGICYAFASLTSLETYLALTYGEYYDFSELHFSTSMHLQDNYYSSITDALHDGGNFSHFTLYSQKDKSIILEQLMPMSKYRSMTNSDTLTTNLTNDFNTVNNNFYPLVKVNSTKSYPQYVGDKNNYSTTELQSFRNDVKQHIMQYGAVTAGIHTNSSFNFNTTNYRITDDSLIGSQSIINGNINHLITIVGWDDNYDANGIWENKGAYLCLNSWGSTFGKDGYFYVSYDDYFIECSIQGVTDATLSTSNNKISTITTYQNQTTIFTHGYSESYPNTFTANIINTSNNIGDKITHIESYIKGASTKFYVKFFNTRDDAIAGINYVTTSISATKVDDYTFGPKYILSSPLTITNNYMVIVREVNSTKKYHSLGGDTSEELGIEPCYSYQGSKIGKFDTSKHVWSPSTSGRTLDYTIPIILHLDTTYIQVSPFESNVLAVIGDKYIKNNAIFVNKSMELALNNCNLSSDDLNNVTINKLSSNGIGADITSSFEFDIYNNTLTISMINTPTNNFVGDCLLSIPCDDITIYRVIEIQNVATFSIDYQLYGGEASNPNVYTNKQTSITLNAPMKAGFIFVGWYTDSEFTNLFNTNELPYTNISLHAKYDFAYPTIISKTNNISITYYKDIAVEISVVATHGLVNEHNTLSYQWYKSSTSSGPFEIVDGATDSTLTLNMVNQSGYYACEVTIHINDTNISASPCSKTLEISSSNAIHVNIKPYIYDMSKVKWNYTEAFSYDTYTHTVELINLPAGVSAIYENNSNSEIGSYIAHATLIYDDMNGNASLSTIDDLNWKICKAKIIITIDSIYSKTQLTPDALQSLYSCHIDNEYLPSYIISIEDKVAYLNLQYILQPTSNNYLYTITATTDNFDIYDIAIIDGEYRVVIHTLADNNIVANNDNGFVLDCTFEATSHQTSNTTIELLKQQRLTLVNAYELKFSYLKDDSVVVNIPTSTTEILNGLSVYMLKNGQLTKLETTITSNQLSFLTSEMDATYLVVKQDVTNTSNSEILTIVLIISVYIGLCICVIMNAVKRKNDFI